MPQSTCFPSQIGDRGRTSWLIAFVFGTPEGIEIFQKHDGLKEGDFGKPIRSPIGIHRAIGARYIFVTSVSNALRASDAGSRGRAHGPQGARRNTLGCRLSMIGPGRNPRSAEEMHGRTAPP